MQLHFNRFIVRYLTALLIGLACLLSLSPQAEARGRDYGQGYKSQWMNPTKWIPTRRNARAAVRTQIQGYQNYRRYGDHRGPGYARASRSYSARPSRSYSTQRYNTGSYNTRSYTRQSYRAPPRTNWGSGRMGTLRRR